MANNHSPILSIDFGTSNSLVGAVVDSQRYEALALDPDAKDPTLMRTLLYFADADVCFYGQNAIHQFIENEMEGRLFRSFKARLPQKTFLGTVMGNRVITLEFMIGVFLLELKKRAEKVLARAQKIEKVRTEILSGKIKVSDYYITRTLCPKSPLKCDRSPRRTEESGRTTQ
jgi:hypothetical chaperone protein